MRLIDADVLIEAINKSTCNWAEHLWKRVVCDVIGNQPTAFDVGKVLEQLVDDSFVDYFEYYTDSGERLITISEAIEIVKSGGINAECER